MDQHSGQGPMRNCFLMFTIDLNNLTTIQRPTELTVITYDLDQAENYLSSIILSQQARSRLTPYHFPINHYKIAYLICEPNSTTEVLIYDGVMNRTYAGHFNFTGSYEGFNGTAAIHPKDNTLRFNRGHIWSENILADGSLELQKLVQRMVRTPRDFDLTPDQKFNVVHQDSYATVFKRNCDNGRLAELSNDSMFWSSLHPFCILNTIKNESAFAHFFYKRFLRTFTLHAANNLARRLWSIKCLSCASSNRNVLHEVWAMSLQWLISIPLDSSAEPRRIASYHWQFHNATCLSIQSRDLNIDTFHFLFINC